MSSENKPSDAPGLVSKADSAKECKEFYLSGYEITTIQRFAQRLDNDEMVPVRRKKLLNKRAKQNKERAKRDCSCAADIFDGASKVNGQGFPFRGYAGYSGRSESSHNIQEIDSVYLADRNLQIIRRAVQRCELDENSAGEQSIYVMAARAACEWDFARNRTAAKVATRVCRCVAKKLVSKKRRSDFTSLMQGIREIDESDTRRAANSFLDLVRHITATCFVR